MADTTAEAGLDLRFLTVVGGLPYDGTGGAIGAACRTAYQGLPVPLLLVCEDNGLGYHGSVVRVTSAHSYIPLGDAAAHVLLAEADIERAAWRLLA